MVFYPSPVNVGTNHVNNLGDGYTISITWHQAAPSYAGDLVATNIYYSVDKEAVFTEGVKLVSVDTSLNANITDLIPGQDYFMAVRPVEYNPLQFNLAANLPVAYANLRYYPTSILSQNIGPTDLIIPLMSVDGFPSSGIILAGVEQILYVAVDQVNNNLIVAGGSGPTAARFVLQPNGKYYLPASNNVGQGVINNLTMVNGGPTETWTIQCIFVEKDNSGNPIPGTAQFIAKGSVSGTSMDQHANYITWISNNTVNSNNVFSFSIQDQGPTFQPGDSFTIGVAGAQPGVPTGRGYNNTQATQHTVSGFDGYEQRSPVISYFVPGESLEFDRIFQCQCRFDFPNFAFTMVDGYKQVTEDLLSTNLTASDADNVMFPEYDYAGYHRTDPVQLLNGTCVGSYIGGQMGCIDGYGNYNIVRGFSLQDQNTQRQDILLSVTGRPACLIRRQQTGIPCTCYTPASEYQDDRCPFCYGTKFVFGYEQYFNPRQSDGRIMVRVGPTPESLKMYEAGLESEMPLDIWTLTVPTIKMRDVLVLFDQDDNEEFRYEVADVTRNNTIISMEGGQHLKVFRVRKFDPIYQIRIFRDTSDFPQTLNTSIGFVPGIPPHTHTIQVNENVISVNQINQTTGISQGHNHPIVNGEVMEVLGHTHQIIL